MLDVSKGDLRNRGFIVTVEDSQFDCGRNGALYFVTTVRDGGVKRY